MKHTRNIILAFVLLLAPAAVAEHHEGEAGHRDHAELTAPNGGRILHEVSPHAELFVTKDRKLQITFLDGEGKIIAPTEQTISAVCGERSKPTKLVFARKGEVFLSDKPLPDGMNIPTVLQIKTAPDAKMVLVRLNLNLADCPECDHLEYACTCDHEHE